MESGAVRFASLSSSIADSPNIHTKPRKSNRPVCCVDFASDGGGKRNSSTVDISHYQWWGGCAILLTFKKIFLLSPIELDRKTLPFSNCLAPEASLFCEHVLNAPAFGKVFLVKKVRGRGVGKLFAMKTLKKASITVNVTDIKMTV